MVIALQLCEYDIGIENNDRDLKQLYQDILKTVASDSGISTAQESEKHVEIEASTERARIARDHADLDLEFRKQDL